MVALPWNKFPSHLGLPLPPSGPEKSGCELQLSEWLAKSTALLTTGFEYPAGVASVSHD